MERLGPLLATPDGHIDFRLDFLQDSDGVNIVESECCTALSMQCQRCFNPVAIEIHTHSHLVVVASEEAARDIPADCEPLLFNGENLDLARMIEDEILLALPIAPRHEHEQCHAGTRDSLAGNRGKNPFSILKNLEL